MMRYLWFLGRYSVSGFLAIGLLTLAALPGWCQPPEKEMARRKVAPAPQRAEQDQLVPLQKQLVEVQYDLRKQLAELTVLQAKDKRLAEQRIPDAMIDAEIEKDPAVTEQRARLDELEKEMQRVRTLVNDREFMKMQARMQERMESYRKDLAARAEGIRPVIIQRLRDKSRADVQPQIEQLQERIAVSRELEKILQAEIKQLNEKAGAGDPTAERLERLEKEVRHLKVLIEELKELVKKGK